MTSIMVTMADPVFPVFPGANLFSPKLYDDEKTLTEERERACLCTSLNSPVGE